jgi:hypothetical protein
MSYNYVNYYSEKVRRGIMTGGATINFGDLGKPANTLIEKIAGAIEGISKPAQIKRLAKAQAEADLIKAESDINIHELKQRALSRFVAEETKKQDNMEKITEKALPLLGKSSDPQKMEDDWITNFFDKSRIISDTEMQTLWSKVLAGEANSPGTFSKRTVNMLGSLDKTDAQLFTKLCSYVWIVGGPCPLVFDENAPIYVDSGIDLGTLVHLTNIGLISLNLSSKFGKTRIGKTLLVDYYSNQKLVTFPKEQDNLLLLGMVVFTNSGEQLQKICDAEPVNGFMDYVIDIWSKNGLTIS